MARKLLIMITAVFVALQCLPVSVSAQNAYTEISNESLKTIPVKTVIHHEEQTAETEEERSSEGTAYAICTDDKELIFFRSYDSYKDVDTEATDILGNTYTGYIFRDIETLEPKSTGNVFWDRFGYESVRVADGQLISPISTAYWFYEKSLTEFDLRGLDTSKVSDMSYMFYNCKKLTALDLSGFDTGSVTNMSHMFSGCRELTELDLSSFDTGNVVNMNSMFSYCNKLTNLKISSFNTVNVTDMGSMFSGCTFDSLDLTNFHTEKVTDMSYMFANCGKLTELDLENFDTANAVNMSHMFFECISLTGLDLSHFDTGNVTDMSNMFSKCQSLVTLDLSSFNTAEVTDMSVMFSACNNLTELNLSSFDTTGVLKFNTMFAGCISLTELDLSSFHTANATTMNQMFGGCSSLTSLDLSNFDTGNVEDMRYMFQNCSSLTDLDISSFDTNKVTDMTQMFEGCGSLTELDLSSFEAGNVTDMSYMFKNCESLTSLDLSDFHADNVTGMREMFYNCKNLISLNLNHFGGSSATNMNDLFEKCYSLQSIDLKGFSTASATSMIGMFYGCRNLESVDLTEFETGNVTNMRFMFRECSKLTELDLSSFDTANVGYMDGMFEDCKLLETIYVSDRWNTGSVTDSYQMFYGCVKLPNFNATDTDVTYAHYGEGGYLTFKEYTEPEIPEDPVFREIRFTDSSLDFKVNEELMISGNYNGPDYESLEIVPSDPSAFELTSSSLTPLGEGYLFIFNLKALKAGEYTLGVTDGYITESIPVSVEDILHEDKSILWFEQDYYESTVYEEFELRAYYAGDHPENLKISTDNDLYDAKLDMTYEKNADGIYEVTIKATMQRIGIHYLLLENEYVYAKANIKVNPIEGEGFTLGRDNNSFPAGKLDNGAGGFNGIDTYAIDPKYYLALVKNAHLGSINEIQKEMNTKWGGACYGIAATMGTLYEKLIDIEDLTRDDTVTCYHGLALPNADNRLLNAIHTMYLSQLLKEEGGKKKAYLAHINSVVPGKNPALPVFLGTMYDICARGGVYLFGYTAVDSDGKDYSHAILAVGTEENEGEYLIHTYDENCISVPYKGVVKNLVIQKDTFDFELKCDIGLLTQDNYKDLYIVDLTKIFDLKGLYKEQMGIEKPVKAAEDSDETMTIKFASDQSIEIQNESGQTLTYDTEQITGDLEIIDIDYVGSEDNVYCRVEVPKYDHLEVTGSGLIDLDAYTNDDFLAIEGNGIDQAVLDMGSGIKLSGSDYQFKAFVSTDPISENENGLISLSGNAESDVYLRKAGTDVEVITEGSVSDVVSESYEGVDVIKETYEHIDEDFAIAEDATIVEKEIVSSEITITSEVKEVIFGNTIQLSAEVTPSDASEKITWSSSDESVAEVDQKGLVKGIKPGSVTITAALNNGSSDSIDLTVLFSDVADNKQYFFNPVYWAVDNEITVGAGGPGKFSPSASCTREQFVTFLWRLKGQPKAKEGCDFADVPKDAWYYEPISWAAENGITTGLNDGTNRFGVGQACTREQCVTFLHRAAGSPEPTGSIEFTDSPEGRYYYKAIKWAAGKRITVGLNDGTGRFGVGQKCTRGMLVTFLYRSVQAQ